ncbi:MAG: hypothetical protein JRJ12_00885 [Deltaproteobacteria bacterium]|nr:hypothetical protein [Deltaproteobacteria bacterium]
MDLINSSLQAIERNRRSGAAQLAARAIQVLITVCRRAKAAGGEELAAVVLGSARKLAAVRPSMAAIRNWSLTFAQQFQQYACQGMPMPELRQKGVLLGHDLLRRQQELVGLQLAEARRLLKNCHSVVTLSYSSTVEAMLSRALPAGRQVTIAESRPLLEGRRLFSRLLESGCRLTMITDAQLGQAVPAADLVLVGADTVLRDLAVVNKSGTYLAALVAKYHQVDFLVAADTFKINTAADSSTCMLEAKSGSEVWRRHPDHCRNVYFDVTPAEFVTAFITEHGILEPPQLQPHLHHWQQLERIIPPDGCECVPPP